MSQASRGHVLVLAATVLFIPLFSEAALSPASADGSTKAEDACKTGETRVTPGSGNPMGTAILGGIRTSNQITVNSGSVLVTCRKLEPWEEEVVTFCGLDDKCKDYRKDSLQGQNLTEIVDEALRGGIRLDDRTYRVSPQELMYRLLDPAQYSKAEDAILHRRMPSGADIGDEHVIDSIIRYASRDSLLNSDARDSARQAIDEIAEGSPEALARPVQKFPEKYPPSWNLSYGVALHDAAPPAEQGPYGLGVRPEVYTLPAQSLTTFEERWTNVPRLPLPTSFVERWGDMPLQENQPVAIAPTFYQRLLNIVTQFKFW